MGPSVHADTRIWFDVGGLLSYFDGTDQATGIQRVEREIFAAAMTAFPRRIRFCRFNKLTQRFDEINFRRLHIAVEPAAQMSARVEPAHRLAHALARRAHRKVTRLMWNVAGAPRSRSLEQMASEGDWLVRLGEWWSDRAHPRAIRRLRKTRGMRFAALVHDLIPIENPEFVPPQVTASFEAFIAEVVALSDLLLVASDNTRRSIVEYLSRHALPAPPMNSIRFGDLFTTGAVHTPQWVAPERFVLYVSTIEPRKNHRILVDIWAELARRHGADALPVLVFAGRPGHGIDELLRMLEKQSNLREIVRIVSNLNDADIRAAYKACLFTVHASLAEGWGLSVGESLALGKPCLCATSTALPEVGGALATYFTPDDREGTIALFEQALFDQNWLADQSARIQRDYRPNTWADCARQLIARLDADADASIKKSS